MPKFDANLSMLFGEVDFLDRFEAAAKAGFTGVEYLFPYSYPKEQLVEKLHKNKLVQVLHNLPAGDWEKGERGIGCLPDRVNEFQQGVGKAIEYATALGCRQVNCLMGFAPEGAGPLKLHDTAVANVSFAASELKKAGIRLLIEPCNTRDIPRFYLNRTSQAIEILNAAGSDNAFLQYDVYHAQMTEGRLINTITTCLPDIGHIQIADVPGRHQPGTGEINYPAVLEVLKRLGYSGYVGLEYRPSNDSDSSLQWLASKERGRNSHEGI